MSLPRDVLDALVRPARFFEERPPTLKGAAYVVLAVALLSAVGLAATGAVLGDAVPGTATVENEAHRSGFQCEKPSQYEEGGTFEEFNWTKPRGCSLPPTKQVDLGGHARAVLTGAAFPAFVAIPLGWLLAAAAFYVLTPGGGADGDLADVLANTGWGFLPLGVLAVLRPVVVLLGAPALSFPDRPGPLADYVREVALGFEFAPLAALSLLVTAWQVYVFACGLREARDVELGRAAVAVVAPTAAALLVAAVDPLAGDRGAAELYVYGLLMVGFGLLMVYFPRALIRHDTRWELIGMRGREHVEPKEWYVALHRVGGVLFAAAGFVVLGGFGYVI